MLKTKELLPVNITLLVLFVAVVAVALTVNRVQTISRSVPHFIYKEVNIQRRAPARVQVKKAVKTQVAKQPPIIKTVPPLFPPQIISKVFPVYPGVAVENGVEGLVLVQVLVSSGGESENVKVKSSSGNELLDKAALFAVSQWEFKPALQGQMPAASWFEVPVKFELI